MLNGLHFVMIHVSNVAEAVAFYTEKLGMTIEDQNPGFVQFKQPAGGGATFAIGVGESTPDPGTELWWFVDSADATYTTLQSKGVEVVSHPTDEPFGRTFAIKAPGGYVVSFLQPAR